MEPAPPPSFPSASHALPRADFWQKGLAVLALVILALAAGRFAWKDAIASFADDSVSYLLMAQCWSPYVDAPTIIRDGCALESYPPLFPFLLAITGTVHNLVAAHQLVALLFVAAVVMTHLLARRLLGNGLPAYAATLLFALSPLAWTNLLGILSENLFLLVSMATLVACHGFTKQPTSSRMLLAGLLLGSLPLIRSVGIALVAAVGISTLANHLRGPLPRRSWIPLLLAPIPSLLWYTFKPVTENHIYAGDVAKVVRQLWEAGIHPLAWWGILFPQVESLRDVWFHSLLHHWWEDEPRYFVMILLALLTLAGTLRRILGNHPDGWYMLFTLGILLVWPYPGQMGRFIYAIFPLLLIHGIMGARWAWSLLHLPSDSPLHRWTGWTALVVLLACMASGWNTILSRMNHPSPHPYDVTRQSGFYRFPDLKEALPFAMGHEHLFQVMSHVRQTTSPQDRILWVTPAYLFLLADRRGVSLPPPRDGEGFLHQVARARADFLLLTRVHPRNPRPEGNGLLLLPLVHPFTTEAWQSWSLNGDQLEAVLLHIDPARLATLLDPPWR